MERMKTLNRRLRDFGLLIDGRPRYRLVWTDNQTEIRRDNFEVFYGNLYLRTEENVTKEVPKYPFAKGKVALEYHTYDHPPNLITMGKGSYEPVWIFRGKNDSFLFPTWYVLQFMIKAFEGGVSERLSPSDISEQERKEFEAEVAQFELEIAEEGRSDLFALGQTAVLNKTKFWEK